MKYMLMMHAANGPYQISSWPQKALKDHIAFMMAFAKKLGAAGELVAAEGLASPDNAKLVRGDKDGAPVTDGVFAESKEFLVGYWIVEVPDASRAYAIAAEASMAPGPKGEPLHLGIEVRQVMSAPPQDTTG